MNAALRCLRFQCGQQGSTGTPAAMGLIHNHALDFCRAIAAIKQREATNGVLSAARDE